jgi:hypothetical protein
MHVAGSDPLCMTDAQETRSAQQTAHLCSNAIGQDLRVVTFSNSSEVMPALVMPLCEGPIKKHDHGRKKTKKNKKEKNDSKAIGGTTAGNLGGLDRRFKAHLQKVRTTMKTYGHGTAGHPGRDDVSFL